MVGADRPAPPGRRSVAGRRAGGVEAWVGFLRPGGTIILRNTRDRDYAPGHDGHRRLAIEELVAPRWREVRQVGATTFAVKQESPEDEALRLHLQRRMLTWTSSSSFRASPTCYRASRPSEANVVRGVMLFTVFLDVGRRGYATTSRSIGSFPCVLDSSRSHEQRRFQGRAGQGRLRAAAAHHIFESERISSQQLEISHYKWTGRALERVRRADEMAGAQGSPWAEQYKSILEHYEHHGRFAWETFGGAIVLSSSLST